MRKQSILCLLLILAATLYSLATEITVRMFGLVKLPGIKQVEEGTGLVGLIYQAGGIQFGGCPKSVVIKTIEDGKARQMEINAFKIVMEDLPDIPLSDNQTIWIPEHMIPCLSPEQVRAFNKQLPIYLKIEPKASEHTP